MAKVTVKISLVYMFDSNNQCIVVDKFPGKMSVPDARSHARKLGFKFTHKTESSHVLDIEDSVLLELIPGGCNLNRECIK